MWGRGPERHTALPPDAVRPWPLRGAQPPAALLAPIANTEGLGRISMLLSPHFCLPWGK